MVKLADIIKKVITDMGLRSSRRILPYYVPDNQFSNTNDPKLEYAKEIALKDMVEGLEYLPPELVENE